MPNTTTSIQALLSNMVASTNHLLPLIIAAGLFIGLGTLLGSCTTQLPPTEYRAYLADPTHGLTHTTESNEVIATCSYRPTDLLVLQDLASVPTATPATRDSLARAYAGKTYCTLTLSRQGSEIENQFVNNPVVYQQVLTYLNAGIAADAFLTTTARDSVPAVASMYMRQFGTTGQSSVLLVFDSRQLLPQQGFHLTLRAQRLGLGTLRFAFAGSDLATLPALKFPY